MPRGVNGGVDVRLDGAHLRVDARPARLVSVLDDAAGAPLLTARRANGSSHSQALPTNARQATFRVRDDITVEATAAAKFVVVADEAGPCLVIAYDGEVTVIPGGDDRFALGAHEALVIAGDGDPAVVPAAELSEANHPELAAMLDAAADAVLPPLETPKKASVDDVAKAAPAAAAASGVKAAKQQPTKAAGQRRKKGKKRPQPAKAAKKATKATKTTAPGGGKPPPPKEPPSTGGGEGGEDADEERRDNRFLIGAVVIGLLLAVGAVLLLSTTSDDDTDVSTGAGDIAETTTTLDESTTTEPETSTTEAATTTAAPTTTASGTQPKYAITPKSCVQNGNSVTYTASITNQADSAFDYEIEVAYTTSDDTEVARATASISRLAPGTSAEFSATGTSSRNLAGTGAECKVVRVEPQPAL